jgi:hypothetical protein
MMGVISPMYSISLIGIVIMNLPFPIMSMS